MRKIEIETEYIRLDSFLKLTGLVDTGGQAKMLVQHGNVNLNSQICLMRGKKLYDGDIVEVDGKQFRVEKCT